MVCFEEKDVFMSKENQRELQDRLGIDSVILPQVFADGQHLGVSRKSKILKIDTMTCAYSIQWLLQDAVANDGTTLMKG